MYSGPQRKHQRLKSYDYSKAGYYFVTICTKGRIQYFGEIEDSEMNENDYGKIVRDEIENNVRENIEIDSYIIMPNHLHLIVIISETAPVGCDCIAPMKDQSTKNKSDNGTMQSFPTLSRVIRGLKGRITSRIQKEYGDYEFAWQKSFYDVIIKTDEQLQKTRQYICDNPKNWDTDSNNV